MDAGRIIGRGISFPPRVDENGRWAWSEGDTNVRESLRTLLRTERFERLMRPEFGTDLARLLAEPNDLATRTRIRESVVRSIAAWEPRVEVREVEVEPHPTSANTAVVTIRYRLVSTNESSAIRLDVSLAR